MKNSLKALNRPNTSIGNSRTQSRLRDAAKQDYIANENSYTDLKRSDQKQEMYRPNSLSSFKQEKITPQKEYSDQKIEPKKVANYENI